MIAVLFWAAVALILFTYLLFPALIFVRGRLLVAAIYKLPRSLRRSA